MIIKAILLCFILLGAAQSHAQSYYLQWWFTFNNQTRLSEKWGFTYDLNYRTRGVFPVNSSLVAARAGVNYHADSKTRLSAGYAWFGTFVNDDETNLLPENRLWQQALWNFNYGITRTNHRIRIEQRWRNEFKDTLQDEIIVAYTNRFRYLIQAQRRIGSQNKSTGVGVSWQAANEIMFHTGDAITKRNFEQNRTLLGAIFHFSPTMELAVLYQYIMQLVPQTQQINHINSVRITLQQNLDKWNP